MDDPSLYFLCVWAFAQLFALDCACGALLRHLAAITAILNLTLMPLLAVVPSFQSISPIIVVLTLLVCCRSVSRCTARVTRRTGSITRWRAGYLPLHCRATVC